MIAIKIKDICYQHHHHHHMICKKAKGFPYSLPSVGPRADPGVQAVSPQLTKNHPPGGRLPLLSARHAGTFPAAKHHRPLAGTKLYCLVTEAHGCEQLAQSCNMVCSRHKWTTGHHLNQHAEFTAS